MPRTVADCGLDLGERIRKLEGENALLRAENRGLKDVIRTLERKLIGLEITRRVIND